MTSLAPIFPKLAKLVPRLASDADGEVVATVRAIDRTLRASGFDWHDFTGALAPALPPPIRPASASPSSAAPQPHWPPHGRAQGSPQSWREIALWCAGRGLGVLSAKEMAFVLDMARELGPCRQPTERQAKWLRAIHLRLRGMQ